MIALRQLAQARTSALVRYARWQGVKLPRRNHHESDQRWHLRAANRIYMELVMRECSADDLGPEPYRDEDSDGIKEYHSGR